MTVAPILKTNADAIARLYQGDARDALGGDLAGDLRHREPAVIALTAGHGDRVVEQDLVGHVDAGGDGAADRHVAGVIVGAVADVLEHVRARAERRLADPVGALAAHLRVAERLAVHPLRHVVAADAGIGARALRHLRGCVVRAAGAEIGRALQLDRRRGDGQADLGDQRREHDYETSDQDHEHGRPIAGIGKAVVEAATLACRSERQKSLKQPALATPRAAAAQTAANRQFVTRRVIDHGASQSPKQKGGVMTPPSVQ